jgi:hypothetical protein
MSKRYIFRWKENGIEVTRSKADTPEAVWAWSEINLRGASETPAQGYRTVHKLGEVIEVKP